MKILKFYAWNRLRNSEQPIEIRIRMQLAEILIKSEIHGIFTKNFHNITHDF